MTRKSVNEGTEKPTGAKEEINTAYQKRNFLLCERKQLGR
jgi:hypothetical protein